MHLHQATSKPTLMLLCQWIKAPVITIRVLAELNSLNLVSYIVSKTNCSMGVDAADDPGMIRYSAHEYEINNITLETEINNTPVMDAANAELKMIKTGTQYLGFP